MWHCYIDRIEKWHEGGVRVPSTHRLVALFRRAAAALHASAFGACEGKTIALLEYGEEPTQERKKQIPEIEYGEEPTQEEERQIPEELKEISTKCGGYISSCFEESAVFRCSRLQRQRGPTQIWKD